MDCATHAPTGDPVVEFSNEYKIYLRSRRQTDVQPAPAPSGTCSFAQVTTLTRAVATTVDVSGCQNAGVYGSLCTLKCKTGYVGPPTQLKCTVNEVGQLGWTGMKTHNLTKV